jgi:outer membrane protein OmpA-like peptidoglycan-associated protein
MNFTTFLTHAVTKSRRVIIAIVALMLGTNNTTPLAAQQEFIRYGAFAHYGINQQTLAFKEFAPSAAIQNFPNANTQAIQHFGLLAEFPLVSVFGIGLRATFSQLSTNFTSTGTPIPSSIGSPDASVRFIQVSHNLETQISTIDAEPYITIRPFGGLVIHLGARAAFGLSSSFYQFERMNDPINAAVYETGTDRRGEQRGTIPGLRGFTPYLMGGLSYEIPLDRDGKFILAPEAFYSYNLGSMLAAQDWRVNTIRAGISLRFAPFSSEQTVGFTPGQLTNTATAPQNTSTPQQPRPTQNKANQLENLALSAKMIAITGVAPSGEQTATPIVRIEEFLKINTHPVLNMVFFDEGSPEIPGRYKRIKSNERGRFSLDNLVQLQTLDMYRHVLNVLGRRMALMPKSRVTLLGYADNAKEANDIKLAQRRAEKVRDYLRDTWGIESSRMSIKTGTNTAAISAEEADEQRRVEIQTEQMELFDGLRSSEVLRKINPPVIRMRFDIESGAGLKEWKLEAVQSAGDKVKTLKTVHGKDTYPETYEWSLGAAPLDSLPTSAGDIIVKLEATDVTNRSTRAPFAFLSTELLTVEAKGRMGKPDEQYEEYDLVPSSILSTGSLENDPAAQRIAGRIRTNLKPDSRVSITGFSDTRTDAALAGSRAQSAANMIGASDPAITNAGQTTIHDNRTPEGRLYNRMVRVEIRNPIH